jgi:hypothetical protein
MLSDRGLHIKVTQPLQFIVKYHTAHPLLQLLRSSPSQLMPHNDILLYALATQPERAAAFELFPSQSDE